MDLEKIRNKSIVEYLAVLGIKPARESGRSFVYYSPWRDEIEPSLHVFKKDNKFKDFGSGERGTVIDLVMRLRSTDFKGALQILSNGEIFSLPEFEKPTKPPPKGIEIVSVNELHSDSLIAYLDKRCIPLDLARLYLKQIEFRFPHGKRPGRIYNAVGFPSDSGGVELRSSFFKVSNSPKNISTIHGDSSRYNIFEGFMDYLSALVFFKKEKFKFTTIVLNSLGYITTLIPLLNSAEMNYLFIDYGKAAEEKIAVLREDGVPVEDCRHYFAGHQDFNDFLVANNL